MAVVTIRQLLDSGVHFGHQTRRWNPKMKRFIFTERSGIYIIDLQQSLGYIDSAYEFVKQTVANGGTILFVGTKKQAQEAIAEQATRVNQPYVNQRWLGGLLTNFQTVTGRLERMKELEQLDYEAGETGFTKKELLLKKRELDKLQKSLGGIRNMTKTPSAMWVVDTQKEHLAINEARKLGIPVIAILDTNCDPDEVTYPIPGNDDAIRSVALLTKVVGDAVAEGLIERHQKPEAGEAQEPLAEWEIELLDAEKSEQGDGTSEKSEKSTDTTPEAEKSETEKPEVAEEETTTPEAVEPAVATTEEATPAPAKAKETPAPAKAKETPAPAKAKETPAPAKAVDSESSETASTETESAEAAPEAAPEAEDGTK